MKKFVRPLFLVVFVCVLWAPLAISSPAHPVENFLESVDVKKLSGDLVIRLKFESSSIKYLSPKFFNKSVEIDFPGSRLKSESKFIPTQDSNIYQVYLSQIDSGMLRLRLMLSQKMAGIEDQLRVESYGNYLEIHIRKNGGDTLESLLARATRLQSKEETNAINEVNNESEFLRVSARPMEPEIVSKTRFPSPSKAPKRDSLLLSEIVGKALPIRSSIIADEEPEIQNEVGLFPKGKVTKANSPDMLSTGLEMFYALVFVLAAMFFIFYLFKRFVWKNGGLGGSGKSVRVLSTGFLGPKKSLALVEIPGEILVLGIAEGHISLLSNIRDEEKIALIKGEGGKKSKGLKQPNESFSNESSSKQNDGGVDVYNRRLVKGNSPHRFSEHLRQSSNRQAIQDPSLKEITSLIRDNLGKIETV